jgi:hypothetical protein
VRGQLMCSMCTECVPLVSAQMVCAEEVCGECVGMEASCDGVRLERSDKASLCRFSLVCMTVPRSVADMREMHDGEG